MQVFKYGISKYRDNRYNSLLKTFRNQIEISNIIMKTLKILSKI